MRALTLFLTATLLVLAGTLALVEPGFNIVPVSASRCESPGDGYPICRDLTPLRDSYCRTYRTLTLSTRESCGDWPAVGDATTTESPATHRAPARSG